MSKTVGMSMTLQDRDEWLAALRSGELKQGMSLLENGGAFCCLGVRANMDSLKGVCIREQKGQSIYYRGPSDQGNIGDFPEVLKKRYKTGIGGLEVKLSDLSPEVQKKYFSEAMRWQNSVNVYSIACLNDKGFTFPEIADIIEQQVTIVESYE